MKTDAFEEIKHLLADSDRFVLAIDGDCGAGKTTLAEKLKNTYRCFVVHLDDFFLPKHESRIGHGNLDKARVLKEVLIPASEGKEIVYRRFSCKEQAYTETVTIPAGKPLIVEGSYALLTEFRFAYTHSIFLAVSASLQEKRIREREGDEKWKAFALRWIPEEKAYHADLAPKETADLVFCMDE